MNCSQRVLLVMLIAVTGPLAVGADDVGKASWMPVPGGLMTKWAADVSPDTTLPEYPRPQMVRPDWKNLNGLWDYALTDKAVTSPPAAYAGKILVPFPMESALSGVKRPASPGQRLWYRRGFTLPAAWAGKRVILHFGAVNWDSVVWLNDKRVGSHRGGYDGFEFDVTQALRAGDNELTVTAWNPVLADVPDAQVLGKQRLKPGGIFYTPATGIWQTVWIEPVPETYVSGFKCVPDIDAGVLRLTVAVAGDPRLRVKAVALDHGKEIAETMGRNNEVLELTVKPPRLWSPDDPHLYDLKITVVQDGNAFPVDVVAGYFAMRKISLGKDATGRTRILLNNLPLIQVGALDQGYWPDGIYTAPTDAALKYDIEAARKLGFNLLRKHAKVEPLRWYYWTDKLGVLVWQDMPQMFGGKDGLLTTGAKEQFETEWRRIIAEFHNAPSIVVWTTFNEGWGQHDTDRVAALTKQLDPSRLVNSASGWIDKNVGDIDDVHAYPGPACNVPSQARAAVNGEFGGLGMRVAGHMWSKGAWGYQGVYSREYALTRHYQKLLRTAFKLVEERATSAIVYTQLTDVEEESNGLLTYDRAVIKPYLDIVSAANAGKFPPLPPDPRPDLVPTSQEEPMEWRFTTEKPADDWMSPSFDDSIWKAGPAAFGRKITGIRTPWTTADIWARRRFTLPAKMPEKLVLQVLHDEDAEIFINGVAPPPCPGSPSITCRSP